MAELGSSMSPLMKSRAKHYVGDLVFSRTGYSGVVLHIFVDPGASSLAANYIVLWTIGEPFGFRIKEQLRDESSIRSR